MKRLLATVILGALAQILTLEIGAQSEQRADINSAFDHENKSSNCRYYRLLPRGRAQLWVARFWTGILCAINFL